MKTKIIHCSDLHLHSKLTANLDKDTATLRRNEIENSFKRMLDFASLNDVSAILICGDIFDASVSRRKAETFFELLYSYNKINFFILLGNHDCLNLNDVEHFKNHNVHIFGDNFTSVNYNGLVVGGISDNENLQQINFDDDNLNLLMMHGEIDLFKDKVVDKKLDYLALGHRHNYFSAKLDDRAKFAYSGCLEGRGFDEVGEMGFVLLEIDDKQIDFKFIAQQFRQNLVVTVDLTDKDSDLQREDAVKQAIEDIQRENLVKIVLTGKVEESIALKKIESLLVEKFFFVKVEDCTKLKISQNFLANDISLKAEFYRQVKSKSLDEETEKNVLNYGLNALSDEEIEN